MKVSQIKCFITSVIVMMTLFIRPVLSADENISFDEKLTHADNIRSSNPKQFLVLVNELNQQEDILSQFQQYYLDYLNLYLLIYQGQLDQAITSANILINSNADSLLKFRTKLSLINTYAINQSWPEGLAIVSSMLTELPSIKDIKNHQLALINASVFYNQMGQYSLGLSYAKRVESTSSRGRDQCIAKGLIIESSFQLNQLTPSDPIINNAISLCRINKEYLQISFIKSYVAKMHLANQDTDKTLQLLNSSLQDTLNTKYPRMIAEYYSLLAQAHWLNKDGELTKQFALSALDQEKERSTTVAKVLSYKLLFEVEQAQQNYELALLYHQKYAIADKQYYDESQAKYLAFQLAEHQALEQRGQIDLLNQKNNLLTAERALTKANTENTRLIIMVLVLTLTVLLFWGVRLLRAHKRIKELAEYDALTGIFNRGHFTQLAGKALKYCQSAEQELSLIMFDLDHFKKINDTYGHACGDWALQQAVLACKNIGRKNDLFARLGGEEFCILLTSCDKKTAQERAEACRQAIENINTQDSGFIFTITASFGVTDAHVSGFELDKLLADADSAAYAAKRAGRNQVSVVDADQQFNLQLV
mgnify:CR=1 FL=1